MIRVIAIATGFDGVALRNIGDEFDMPDDVFEPRQRLNDKGEPIKDSYYEPPSWFEPVDDTLREQVRKDRATSRRVNRLPAVDPARQQAEAQAEAKRISQAQEEVRVERAAEEEASYRKDVNKRASEIKSRRNEAGSDPRDTRAAEVRTADAKEAKAPGQTPSPDNMDRTLGAQPPERSVPASPAKQP